MKSILYNLVIACEHCIFQWRIQDLVEGGGGGGGVMCQKKGEAPVRGTNAKRGGGWTKRKSDIA